MSLRQLKQKIREQESITRKQTGNPQFKDLELRRRFNLLAGGADATCTYQRPHDTGRQLYAESLHHDGTEVFCPSDKSNEECKGPTGEACAPTDGNGLCPENCKPVKIYEPTWLKKWRDTQ